MKNKKVKLLKNTQKAFTLIELLVVISIIGSLSSIVLSNVSKAREKSLMNKTFQEMRSLQGAIELYRLQNGKVPMEAIMSPNTGYPINNLFVDDNWGNSSLDDELSVLISPVKYISKIPHAPGYYPGNENNPYYLVYMTRSEKADAKQSYIYTCGGRPIDTYAIVFYTNGASLNFPRYGFKIKTENFIRDLITDENIDINFSGFYCVSG